MLKVLKAKMFRMIKYLADQFLITTRRRHLVEYFENHYIRNLNNNKISHLETLYDESAQSKDVQNDF